MFAAQRIPYQQTNAFTPIILDYLEGNPSLEAFYSHKPDWESIPSAIQQKAKQPVNRKLLVEVLENQYAHIASESTTASNIQSLLSSNTFTICTAHQPNLFTGPLYFIYKIIHAIKLADELKRRYPDHHFVPLFYMGSEDADLAELNHFTVQGKTYAWKTNQKGAVGRMNVDQDLLSLIKELEGQLHVYPEGERWITLLKNCFSKDNSIQEATFKLVHSLFGNKGLIVLIADDRHLKALMKPVFEDDLLRHVPSTIVNKTSQKLQGHYNAQAYARDINLFYLKDDTRERIELKGEVYTVCNTAIQFTKDDLLKELDQYPERFSPNVILRGLYQETLLPNIIFIGGGGEVAYWLQLKDLFDHYNITFPTLVLRNSFLILDTNGQERIQKLDITLHDLFKPSGILFSEAIQSRASHKLSLNGNLEMATELYSNIREQAAVVDPTLAVHVNALQEQALKKLKSLEKKMVRAEKRKHEDVKRQIESLKAIYFPQNGLQERKENAGFFYAMWGSHFMDQLYEHSLSLEQEFTVLLQTKA